MEWVDTKVPGDDQTIPEVTRMTNQIFTEINFPISNEQRAVAGLAYLNSSRRSRQIIQMGASKGKSRVHAFLT